MADLILSEHVQQLQAYLQVRDAALKLEYALTELERLGCEAETSPVFNPRKPEGKPIEHLDALLDYNNTQIKTKFPIEYADGVAD